MREETLALHAGFDADPATRVVAVPITRTEACLRGAAAARAGTGIAP